MLKQLRATTFLAAVLCSVVLATGAAAQSASYHFDIPGKALSEALRDYGQVSGLDIIFTENLVRGLSTAGLLGEFTPEDALQRLLQGTGLIAERSASGALMIQRVEVDSQLASEFADSKALSLGQRNRSAEQAVDSKAAERETVDNDDDEGGDTVMDPDYVSDENPKGIPEIMVIGSRRTLNMDIERTQDDIQPYVVFDRDEIDNSGAATLDEFFKNKLTMSLSTASGNQIRGRGGRSAFNLRGLGTDETLILIDGRRKAAFSDAGTPRQPDINGIPLAAIERIEVLPTTASGIYGGGATGGVINIVLRRDYSGIETRLTYGNTFASDAASRRVDLSAGFNFENGKTNLMLAGSYADSNDLLTRERDFYTRGREHVLATNPQSFFGATAFPPLGATPNIQSNQVIGGVRQPLTLDDGSALNSTFTFIPAGYAGSELDGGAALVPNAGQYNLDLADTAQPGGSRRALLSTPETKSLIMTLRRSFTPRVDAFLELQSSDISTQSLENAGSFAAFIPGDAANNPFQQDVRVFAPSVGLDGSIENESKDRRAAVGVIIELPAGWRATADYTWNRSEASYRFPERVSESTLAAINSGSIDILRDLNMFPVDFGIGLPQQASSPAKSSLKNATMRLAGPLPWSFPGGPIILSTMIERLEESFNELVFSTASFGDSLIPSKSQSANSVYLEAQVPLVSARNNVQGIKLLEFQIAVRRDDYRVNGATGQIDLASPTPIERFSNENSSTDPTFGLRFQPLQDLTLRGSYGTGFLPPSVTELVPSSGTINLDRLADPLREHEPLGPVLRTSGGNPDLRPEESESWSAGLVLTPRIAPSLRFSADWSRIEKTDAITTPRVVTQAEFEELMANAPERIIRGSPSDGFPVGPIVAVDLSRINLALLEVEAVDFAVDYEVQIDHVGTVGLAVDASRLIELKTQATPTAAAVENAGVGASVFNDAGTGGALKWRINASLDWVFHGWNLGWRTRYFDSYFVNLTHTLNPNQGSATVPSQIYHDVYGSYRFGPALGSTFGMLSDTEIQFGINNVFNKKPPIDVVLNTADHYSYFGDPRLANYYLGIRKSFGGKQ